jgi:tRNA U34 2-thiouridine synthase MnmA/TrmU
MVSWRKYSKKNIVTSPIKVNNSFNLQQRFLEPPNKRITPLLVERGPKVKALGMLSGGLDSTLAVKVMLEQGIEVEAINFVTPFCQCRKGGCGAVETAKTFNIPLKMINAGTEYLRVIRKPKFGYGKNLNPCVDCRIFMLKKAKKYARQIGAKFIFTGEVLGQRPMSQHRGALGLIEREAGLEGKIVRPLSGKLLPKTEAESKGFIEKKALRDISGRSRKRQIEMTKEFNINQYPCAAGGCRLTDREFANKLRDLFRHKKRVTIKEVNQLKVGRHFRLGENKIIVGRNEAENKVLLSAKRKSDFCFEVPNCGSPTTILQGPKTREAIEKAAALTVFHSDKKIGKVEVHFGKRQLNRKITVLSLLQNDVDRLRV